MKIIVEGTDSEIKKAKSAIEGTCFLDSEFCDIYMDCDECEAKKGLKKEYKLVTKE